jgi:ammonium transporter Rh
MTRKMWASAIVALLAAVALSGCALAQAVEPSDSMEDVDKYYRAIDVMAMLLLGFGFLMAFIRGYGRSALGATLLLVSVGLVVYVVIRSLGVFGVAPSDIDTLILAEFATASLLICAGAALGRLKMPQYVVLGVIFIPFYMANEWIILGGGLGILPAGGFVDTGGSIVIHAFGAFFGLGVVLTMTTASEFKTPIAADQTSDKFSLLGTMVLWIFWPSFCAALVLPDKVPSTALNVLMALCGSTLATYVASTAIRGKMSVSDLANAALAGGVAIGATCDHASFPVAILIGVLAGTLSTIGFAVIQPRLQGRLKAVDTCGVTNLHGFPGLMGGVAAMVFVAGIALQTQALGIAVTLVVALLAGLLAGKILSALGRKEKPYEDSEDFIEA